jgi:hypothetical protein
MKLKFHVGGFTPLSSRDSFDKEFPFADDGTLTVEIPLWLAREVTVGIQGMSFPKIIIAPGQETSILLKVTNDQRPFLAFKGYMAKTNMDLIDAYSKFEPYRDNDSTFLKVKNCNTKEERLQCLTDIFNQRVADIKATKYTKAAKDLLCMAAEDNFVKWTRQFAFIFSEYGVDDDGIIYRTIDHFDEKLKMNEALLPLSQEEIPYTFKYLNEPASPCSSAFWQRMVLYFDKTAAEKNAFNLDLLKIPFKLANDSTILEIIGDITNEDCLAVLREYEAEQLRIADQLTNQENVFYQKFDDVAPENILQTILDRYKDTDDDKLLPFISNQNYNEAIKEMFKAVEEIDHTVTILDPVTRLEKQAKLSEVASSHMGRRNFCGNLYDAGFRDADIASMSGHAEGSKAISRYRKVSDEKKQEMIDSL